VQTWIANLVHLLIYRAAGRERNRGHPWAGSRAADPIVFFGAQLADAHAPSPTLNHLCILVGMTTARVLVVMIALHVLAVVKHEWLDRDRLLARMLPGPAILLPLSPREIMRRLRERRQKRRGGRAASKDRAAANPG
jgi:cytochrome b561